MTVTSTSLLSNRAGSRGGGLFADGARMRLANSVVGQNAAGEAASGLYFAEASGFLLHTTLAQNSGGDGSGILAVASQLRLTNTILVSHTVGISITEEAVAELGATLWGSGTWANGRDWDGGGTIITGTQNYWADPHFVDPGAIDYHIGPASAAIDRGMDAGLADDVDNQPRPNPDSGLPDLGADELWLLTPLVEVGVTGPVTGTTYTPVTFTAVITPPTATPNILYWWTPPPDAGQWTEIASYTWPGAGEETIQVKAIQAGGVVSDSHTILIETRLFHRYLPIIAADPEPGF
jgi:hypothetical protein